MNKRDIWICSLLGLGALVMRMLLISKGPFSPESLNLALKAEATLDTMQLQYLFGTGYPLTMMITAASIFIGRFLGIDDPVFAANLMSVYASAASIPLFYLLVKRLTDVPTAVISAVLLAVSPIYLGISVYAKGHALEISLYLRRDVVSVELRGTEGGQRLVVERGALRLFGRGAGAGPGLCVAGGRIYDVCLAAGSRPIATPARYVRRRVHPRRGGGRDHRGVSFAVLIGSGPGGVPRAIAQLSRAVVYRPARAEFVCVVAVLPRMVSHQLHNIRFDRRSPRSGPRLAGQLAGHGLQPAVVRSAVRVYLVIDTTIPRLFTVLLPPVIVFAAFFLAYGYRRQDRLSPTLGTLIAVLLAGTMFGNIYPVLNHRHHNAVLPDYVRWVRAQVPANARVICKDDFIFYEHYGPLATLKRPNPGSRLETLELYRNRLRV